MKKAFATTALVTLAGLTSLVAAQIPDPAFLRHFQKEHRTLLVISDPLPWVKNLLTDPRLRRIFREGQLGRQIMRETGRALDPQEGWTIVSTYAQFVPRELVIGIADSAMEDFDHLVRTGMLIGLCHGAKEAGAKKDLTMLRQQVLDELRVLKVPSMRIWIRMRHAADAAPVAQQIQAGIAELAARLGVRGQAIRNGVEYRLTVGEMMDAEGRSILLRELELVDGENDPLLKPLSAALAALTLYVRLEQAEDGVRLTLGSAPPGTGAALTIADLGPTYASGSGQMFWGRWEIARLKQASRGWVKLWRTWEDTTAGKRLAASDDEDLIGTLSIVDRQLQRYADSGAMRIWAEKGVQLLVHETGVPRAEPIASSRVLAALPAKSEAMGATTIYSLGDYLSDALAQVEDRLAMKSLQAEIQERQDRAARYERFSRLIYRDLARFRQIIHKSAVDHFDRDVAWIIGSRGVVKKLEVKIGNDTFSGINLPMMELAIIGRTRDVQKTQQLVGRAYAAFVEGLSKGLMLPASAPARQLKEVDLALGTRTWGFDTSWLGSVGEAAITVDGDATPHFFFIDDLFVWSTSPRLSREIIASNPGGGRATLPAGKVVSFGRVPGATLGTAMEMLAKWSDELKDSRDNPVRRQNREEFSRVFSGMGELARLVDVMEWHSADEGQVRVTRGRIAFAEQR